MKAMVEDLKEENLEITLLAEKNVNVTSKYMETLVGVYLKILPKGIYYNQLPQVIETT